jgi:hypothetical protein
MENINLIDNYIYLYHLDAFVVLPTVPETVSDAMATTFAQTPIMMRTAPIFSYSYSGPRTININLTLRRDMFEALNVNVSNLAVEIGDDYVDTIIKQLQAASLPRYAIENKMVDPPMVAVRFGSDIFIKGVLTGGITVTYGLPLLESNKYASIEIQFTVAEVDPYDAETVTKTGSFRGLARTLERSLYK